MPLSGTAKNTTSKPTFTLKIKLKQKSMIGLVGARF